MISEKPFQTHITSKYSQQGCRIYARPLNATRYSNYKTQTCYINIPNLCNFQQVLHLCSCQVPEEGHHTSLFFTVKRWNGWEEGKSLLHLSCFTFPRVQKCNLRTGQITLSHLFFSSSFNSDGILDPFPNNVKVGVLSMKEEAVSLMS